MTRLHFGHLAVGSVRDVIAIVRGTREITGAVIRSLDSARSQRDVSQVLSFHKVDYRVVASHICVAAEELWKAWENEVFAGFDEVWPFREKLPSVSLEFVPNATSDGENFSEALPVGLGEAVEQSDCLLVNGDGCGLNYASHDAQLLDRIREGIASA